MSYETEWAAAQTVTMQRVSTGLGSYVEITDAPALAIIDSSDLSVDHGRNRIVLTADNMLLHYEILDSQGQGNFARRYLGKLIAKAELQPVEG